MILNAKEMLGKKISASLHKALNVCRGVISVAELLDILPEDDLINLRDQQVIDLRKLKIRKNNEYITTRNVVLTFDRPTLPDKIKVRYLSAEARNYIHNPQRCFRSSRFGHAADTCRGFLFCARCGQSSHDTKQCKGPDHCINSPGDHNSYSRSCPKWKMEKEILHIKVTQNIAYPEATKRVAPLLLMKSLADAAQEKRKMVTRSTQTDPLQKVQAKVNEKKSASPQSAMETESFRPSSAAGVQLRPSSPVDGNTMECFHLRRIEPERQAGHSITGQNKRHLANGIILYSNSV